LAVAAQSDFKNFVAIYSALSLAQTNMRATSLRTLRRMCGAYVAPAGSLHNTNNVFQSVRKIFTQRNLRPRYLSSGQSTDNGKKEPDTGITGEANKTDDGTQSSSKNADAGTSKPPSVEAGKVEPEKHSIAADLGSNIASTIHFTQHKYEELEKVLMDRVHVHNVNRFREMVLRTLLGIVASCTLIWMLFGHRIRRYFTEQTADLAMETLENKELKIQTEELATAVVQTILENQEIASQAAVFLKEASSVPETQQALLKLTLHVLQHKDTMSELTKISQRLIKDLANDKVAPVHYSACSCACQTCELYVITSVDPVSHPVCLQQVQETVAELAQLVQRVLADPDLRAALVTLVGQLCHEPEVLTAVTDLLVRLAAEGKVTEVSHMRIYVTVASRYKGELFSRVHVRSRW
jgi:ferredoxin